MAVKVGAGRAAGVALEPNKGEGDYRFNLWADPAFVDPDNGDYRIGAGSAAIDAGVDAGVTTDIDGETRPFGAGYDIGADEWVAR